MRLFPVTVALLALLPVVGSGLASERADRAGHARASGDSIRAGRARVLRTRAARFARQGAPGRALANLARSALLAPDEPETWSLLAGALEREGRSAALEVTRRIRDSVLRRAPAAVSGVEVGPAEGGTRVRLRVGRAQSWTLARLLDEDHPRVYVDLEDARLALSRRRLSVERGGIERIRTAERSGRSVRIVLDLRAAVPVEGRREGEDVVLTLDRSGDAFPVWRDGSMREKSSGEDRVSGTDGAEKGNDAGGRGSGSVPELRERKSGVQWGPERIAPGIEASVPVAPGPTETRASASLAAADEAASLDGSVGPLDRARDVLSAPTARWAIAGGLLGLVVAAAALSLLIRIWSLGHRRLDGPEGPEEGRRAASAPSDAAREPGWGPFPGGHGGPGTRAGARRPGGDRSEALAEARLRLQAGEPEWRVARRTGVARDLLDLAAAGEDRRSLPGSEDSSGGARESHL